MAPARRKQPERKAEGDYHHGNLRRALLDAAGAILAVSSPESFTLREAARRVGVDHRAAYRHFSDRDGLLAAVAEEGYRALITSIGAELAAAAPPTRSRLLAVARAYTRFAVAEPGRYQVMMGPRAYQRFPDTDAAIDDAFAILQRELARGVDRGEVIDGDVVELAAWLWSAMHGLAHLILVRRVRVRRDLLGAFTDKMIGNSLGGILRG